MQRVVLRSLGLAALGCMALACGGLMDPEVVVANGYDAPITVVSGETSVEVAAHSIHELKVASPFTIEARLGDVVLDTVTETCDLGELCVFNVAGRMPLASGEVHYGGSGEVPVDVVLPVQSFYRPGDVDYAFEEPPVQMSVGTFEEKVVTVLYDMERLYTFEENFRMLLADYGPEAAIAFLDAQLLAVPDDAEAFRLYGEAAGYDAQVALCRGAIEADPGNQAAHVQLQSLLEWEVALAEYAALHAERDDALSAYLYGRLLAAKNPERSDLLSKAASTIPDAGLELAPTLALLGHRDAAVVAYEEALGKLPKEDRRPWQRDRLRLAQIAGKPLPIDQVVEDSTLDSDVVYYSTVFLGDAPPELKRDPMFNDMAAQAYLAVMRGDFATATQLADELGGLTAFDLYQAVAHSDGVDPELVDYVAQYYGLNTLLTPPKTIPEAWEMVATEGSVINVGLFWLRTANDATDPELRQLARDQARIYLLPDELPYWTD